MKGICPNCEEETTLERISTTEVISVRGEEITVPVELLKCSVCGEDFEDPSAEGGSVERAYREYRNRKGMISPEELRSFRARFELTQSELGRLLGFGAATINRYENGALQDEAHDKALRLAMRPHNLLKLIEEAPGSISSPRQNELLERLRREDDCFSIQSQLDRLSSYRADNLSGYKEFDFVKFLNSVLLFCKEGTFTTSLNKFLFYGDFLHFKKFAVSITGLRYAHMPFGPAPDKYRFYFALVESEQLLEAEEVPFDGGVGEKFFSATKPSLDLFSESELRCLLHVKARFEKTSASDFSRYSHEETAYKNTQNGELIPYDYAESLSLDF